MGKKEIFFESDFDESNNWLNNPIVSIEKPFIDKRGKIQPLVDRLMRSAVLINSKAGSLRANHYHKTDWHYCYILSGSIEYFYRKTGLIKEPKKVIVNKGQMIFTPPMVDHAMKFPEDTIFLTLSRNPRDQETYEKDVIRINMIDNKNLISWHPDEEKI